MSLTHNWTWIVVWRTILIPNTSYYRPHRQWRILMSGNGNSACCYEMIKIKRLYLEIKEISETLNRYPTLPSAWGYTGKTLYFTCIFLVFCVVFCWGSLPKMLWIPLFSELYGKVVVASKVPLPNYRPDLDDKRPQREVRKFFPGNFSVFVIATSDLHFWYSGKLSLL